MATLLLTDVEHPESIIAAHGRARTRLWSRAHAHSLDRCLAAGACPDTSAALSIRAERLIGRSARRGIAKSLREVVDLADRPLSTVVCNVPLCRRKILASAPSLLELARRIESPQPVDARGVARAMVLLTAGDGPLYDRPNADDLEAAIQAALAALDMRL